MAAEGSQCMDLFFLEELMKVDTAAGVVTKEEGEEEDDEEAEQADACSEDLGDAPAPPTPTQDQALLPNAPAADRLRSSRPGSVQ